MLNLTKIFRQLTIRNMSLNVITETWLEQLVEKGARTPKGKKSAFIVVIVTEKKNDRGSKKLKIHVSSKSSYNTGLRKPKYPGLKAILVCIPPKWGLIRAYIWHLWAYIQRYCILFARLSLHGTTHSISYFFSPFFARKKIQIVFFFPGKV